jgi:hypothetical protein
MKATVLGRTAAAFASLLALALVPTEAEAAGRANGFGDKSQLIITADRLLPVFGYTYSSVTTNQNAYELTDSRSGSGI